MAMHDYRCGNGHTDERLMAPAPAFVDCRFCGDKAERIAANRVAIGSPYVDTRGLYRRYVEASSEMDFAATRIEQNTGQRVETPNFWKSSSERAKQVIASGEAPPLRKD